MKQASTTLSDSRPPELSRFPWVDHIQVSIPMLPPELEGFRILHISDLHVRRPRRRLEKILKAVEQCEHDLLAITGDCMIDAGDEPAAAEFLTRLGQAARPRVGQAGVWGNHDTPELRTRCEHLPIRWLVNAAWNPPGLPLTVLGVDCAGQEHQTPRGDLAAALAGAAVSSGGPVPRPEPCRLLLAHMPSWLPAAAAADIDLLLSGHTHAGQIRLPTGHILYNATPGWPCRYSSGLMQLGSTQCLVSRGLGEVYVPGLRFFCKPQMPLVTLRCGEQRPSNGRIVHIRKW